MDLSALPTLLQTAATFILILGILVFFHELGHFSVAKFFKMRVEEFAIGFGPRMVRLGFDGETEYTIRWLPLGGFVRIAGMEIEDAAERRLTEGFKKNKGTETTTAGLLAQETAEVDGAVKDGFNTRPIFQRFWVILAGPLASFALGWLALCLMGSLFGVPTKSTLKIAEVTRGGVADQAGLRAGDTLVALNGARVESAETLLDTIRASAGKPLILTARAPGGVERTVPVTPRAENDAAENKTVGRIGIKPTPIILATRRLGLGESFAQGTAVTGLWFQTMSRLVVTGGLKNNIGGPVSIARATQDAVEVGGPQTIFLLGQLSLSLGFFNLLPIPILDGGHLALMAIEKVRRRKLTAEQTQRVFTAGFALMLVLFAYVMFKDLFGRG